MLYPAVVSLLAVTFAWFTWKAIRARLVYDLHRIPGPPAWPLIGNLDKMIGSSYLHKTLADWTKKYGPIYRWRLGPVNMLVVTDPAEVSRLCSKELNLPKCQLLYKPLETRPPHHNFLATPNYEEWKYIRKTMNPAFSPDNIRKMYPSILSIVVQAADALGKLSMQGPVEMDNFSQRITADIIAKFGFEEEMGNLVLENKPDGKVALVSRPEIQASKVMQDVMSTTFTNPLYALTLALCPWLEKARAFKAALAQVSKIQDQQVTDLKARGVQPDSNISVWACLGRLVDYRDGSQVPNDFIAAQAGILFAAGFETSAHTLGWAFFELAANPALQARVHKELVEAGLAATPEKPPPRPLDFADLSKLPWVDSIARETLRLHATAPFGAAREAKDDMTLMGYRIPKGTAMLLSPYAMHTSSGNFLHPNKFWPERWLPETPSEDSKGHPEATAKGNRRAVGASWNPFSCGPRNCIGQSLALAEIRTVLAVLLARFRFELPEGMQRDKFIETEQVAWVTLQPRQGVHLKAIPLDIYNTPADGRTPE